MQGGSHVLFLFLMELRCTHYASTIKTTNRVPRIFDAAAYVLTNPRRSRRSCQIGKVWHRSLSGIARQTPVHAFSKFVIRPNKLIKQGSDAIESVCTGV